jgi:hypothetical protein
MMLFNLVNIISKPTRITAYSNTLLDPIIISDTMNYIYSDELYINQTSRLNETETLFEHCKKATEAS